MKVVLKTVAIINMARWCGKMATAMKETGRRTECREQECSSTTKASFLRAHSKAIIS